jgi:FkbM family methyltransferase
MNKPVHGILHVGAHLCEELEKYNEFGYKNIIWIEADPDIFAVAKKSYPDEMILNYLVTDVDDERLNFNVANNGMSSSILNFGTHSEHHEHIKNVAHKVLQSKRIDTIYKLNNIDKKFANFLNIDIQGAELLALKGMGGILDNFDYIYVEVNTEEVYEKCALLDEIKSFLVSHNFAMKLISMTTANWGDAFFVKNDNATIAENKIKLMDTFLFKNFDDKGFVHRINPHTDKVALLLEPRCHYRMRPIVVNHLTLLGPEWNLLYIGTQESINYLKAVLPFVEFEFVVMKEQNINDYQVTEILLGKQLNHEILKRYENIMVFQMDSVMFKPFDEKILEHKYVGASDIMQKTDTSYLKCYNGGISFRKKTFINECIEKYSHEYISDIRKQNGWKITSFYPEDFYLSMCLSLETHGEIIDLDSNDENMFFLQNNLGNVKDKKNILDGAMALHNFDKHTNRHISFEDMKYLVDSYPNNFVDIK